MNLFSLFRKKKPAQHLIGVTVHFAPYGKRLEVKFMVADNSEFLPQAKEKVFQEVAKALQRATIETNKVILNKRDMAGIKKIKV